MLHALVLTVVAAAPGLSAYPEAPRSGKTLTLPAGSTAKVTLRIPITGPPSRSAQVLVRSAGWAGVADVLPMGEVVRIERKPSAVDVAVIISANAVNGRPQKGAIRVVVNDPNIGRRVGETTWRPNLEVRPSSGSIAVADVIQQLHDARSRLNMVLSATGPVATRLRSSGMVVLRPDTAQWRDALDPVIRVQARVQALAAQLRATGLAGRDPNTDAAIRGLAANRGPAQRPTPQLLEKLSPDRALRRTAALLERLQFEQTVGWSDALIDSQRLQRSQLAQALVLRATAQAVGGFEEEARLAFGQASCLDPVARPPSRPLFDAVFGKLAQPPACAQPLNVLGVTAVRAGTEDGVTVTVSVAYGPDPFSLISGGTVQLFDARGALVAQQPGAPEQFENQSVLVAEFIDDGTLTDASERLYVAATLDGPGRVAVAEAGTPEPEIVTIADTGTFGSGGGLPLWLWIALGVAAVGGATAAAVVAASGGDGTDADRGIGPINIRF